MGYLEHSSISCDYLLLSHIATKRNKAMVYFNGWRSWFYNLVIHGLTDWISFILFIYIFHFTWNYQFYNKKYDFIYLKQHDFVHKFFYIRVYCALNYMSLKRLKILVSVPRMSIHSSWNVKSEDPGVQDQLYETCLVCMNPDLNFSPQTKHSIVYCPLI